MKIEPSAPFLLCASPRQGNSLTAAQLFARGFNTAGSAHESPGPKASANALAQRPQLSPVMLSAHKVLPCVACGKCSQNLPCPLLQQDDSAILFEALLHAPLLAFSVPVYFYHVPAQFKAFIDRCQQYYAWRENKFAGLESLPRRKAFVMFSAARERGEKLFQGSILSLKFALEPFNIELTAPLTMRGLDQPNDLNRHDAYQKIILEYGTQAFDEWLRFKACAQNFNGLS